MKASLLLPVLLLCSCGTSDLEEARRADAARRAAIAEEERIQAEWQERWSGYSDAQLTTMLEQLEYDLSQGYFYFKIAPNWDYRKPPGQAAREAKEAKRDALRTEMIRRQGLREAWSTPAINPL